MTALIARQLHFIMTRGAAVLLVIVLIATAAVAFDTARKASKDSAPIAQEVPTDSDSDDDAVGKHEYIIQHALSNDDTWSSRGRVFVEFSRLTRSGSVKVSPFTLDGSQMAEFKNLVDRDGFYRIRLVPEKVPMADTLPNAYPVGSVKACSLHASDYKSVIILSADVYGHVVAVDFRTPIVDCSVADEVPTSAALKTNGKVLMARIGERPFEAPPKPEAGPAAEEEKSFFQKYWMYIVPAGLFFLLQLAVGPEASGGNGAAAGGGGGGRGA